MGIFILIMLLFKRRCEPLSPKFKPVFVKVSTVLIICSSGKHYLYLQNPFTTEFSLKR